MPAPTKKPLTRRARERKRTRRLRYESYLRKDWPKSPPRPTREEIIKEEEQYATLKKTSDGEEKLMYLCHVCNEHFERIKDRTVNWKRSTNTFTCYECKGKMNCDVAAYDLGSDNDEIDSSNAVGPKHKCTQCGNGYYLDKEPDDFDPWDSRLVFCKFCIRERLMAEICCKSRHAYPWN